MRKLPILVFFAASLIVCGPDTQRRDERRRSLEIVEALTFFLFYRPCLPFTWIPKGQSRTVTPPFDFDPCRPTGNGPSAIATLSPVGGQDINIQYVSCSGSITGMVDSSGPGGNESVSGSAQCNGLPESFYRVINNAGTSDVTITVN